MAIRQLQQEYCETGDNRLLTQLYNELLWVGFWQIEHYPFRRHVTREDVYDIASGVVERLMKSRAPIIKSAPSSYVKAALFYKAKENQNRPLSLDTDKYSGTLSVVDIYDCDIECIADDCMDRITVDEAVEEAVHDVTHREISLADARATMRNNTEKRLFAEAMEEVKTYVSKTHM